MPELDLVSTYRIRGLGKRLAGSDSAFRELGSGDYQEYEASRGITHARGIPTSSCRGPQCTTESSTTEHLAAVSRNGESFVT